jgi:hypothetical protein
MKREFIGVILLVWLHTLGLLFAQFSNTGPTQENEIPRAYPTLTGFANGSFEMPETYNSSGKPTAPGDWWAESATAVGPQLGITPYDGSTMLRFNATTRVGARTNSTSSSIH